MATGRGAVVEDFNLDGWPDILVVNRRTPPQIWRNTGTGAAGGWLQVALRQPGANPDAIGAWIEVRRGDTVTRREITAGGGHASGQAGWRHMGLGAAGAADLRVIWPDGTIGPWQAVQADSFVVAERDRPLRPWVPGGGGPLPHPEGR
jgi:hypothetical protein